MEFIKIINNPELYWNFLLSIDTIENKSDSVGQEKYNTSDLKKIDTGGSGDKVWIGNNMVVKEYTLKGKNRKEFIANEILITWFLSNVMELKWPNTNYYMYPKILSVNINTDRVQISQTLAPGITLFDFKCDGGGGVIENPNEYYPVIVYQLVWMIYYTNKILQEKYGLLFSHNDLHPSNIFIHKMTGDEVTVMYHEDYGVVSEFALSIIDMGEGTMRKTNSYNYLNDTQSGLKSFRSSTKVLENFRNCKWERGTSAYRFVRHALSDRKKKGQTNNIDLTFWITIAKYLIGSDYIDEKCRLSGNNPDKLIGTGRYDDCMRNITNIIPQYKPWKKF